ncbi:MAG: hypothetical protein ABJA67_01890 [Chthonomonadales bacterium]
MSNQTEIPDKGKPSSNPTEAQAAANSAKKSFLGTQKWKKVGVAVTGIVVTGLGVAAPVKPIPSFPDTLTEIKCGMVGASLKKPLTDLDTRKNPLKNRYEVPDEGEIDSAVSIGDFLGPDDKTMESSAVLNENQAATVTGYIVKVVTGGGETCNCQTSDTTYYDTHIYLSSTDPTNRPPVPKGSHDTTHDMIVEVTPRMRQIVKPNSTEWNTDELVKTFKRGTKVTVTGWQFYDKEHEPAAFNINHKPSNWRYSCWELHPVTAIDKVQ